MTVKQFFKSTAFKCIAVLMSVLLISGVLLAVCWGFLEVTDEERFNRKIGAVYSGETFTTEDIEKKDLSGINTKVGNATIDALWYIKPKNDYLVQASSRGYGGDITCWIAVNMKENKTEVKGIGKVILYSVGDPAELTGNIPNSVYDKFPAEYTDGKTFEYGYASDGTHGSEYIGTGATSTMTAICNDVNGAVAFVKAYANGEEIVNPFAGYQYAEYIDETTLSKITVSGTSVNYEVTTITGLVRSAFNIKISVDKVNGTPQITNYEIVQNGSSKFTNDKGENIDYSIYMRDDTKDLSGKTLTEIQARIAEVTPFATSSDKITTGATASRSDLMCYQSAAFALANYDKVISENSQGGNA